MWNLFLEICWLPFAIAIWAIKSFLGYDLNSTVIYIWDKIVDFDCIMFPFIKFSFTHWSSDIQDLCFNCCRVKPDAVTNRGKDLNTYTTVTGPSQINQTFESGYNTFKNDGWRILDDFDFSDLKDF